MEPKRICLFVCLGFAALIAVGAALEMSRSPYWFKCHGYYTHAYGNWSTVEYVNGGDRHVGVQARTCERCGIQEQRRLKW